MDGVWDDVERLQACVIGGAGCAKPSRDIGKDAEVGFVGAVPAEILSRLVCGSFLLHQS